MNPTNSKESSSTEASESEVEDPSPNAGIIRDTKSLCLDTISEYSDTRSVYSEAPIKKVSASKNSEELVKLRKSPSLGSSTKLRSTGTSPEHKTRKDSRLPLSPMSPLSPRRRRLQTGHASDSELP
ncbi:hypothetical protein HID58_090309 [Brassica napus]|uniref:Uncharacterized protein n=1 Tax=Brassica napus TaxID=3708 RepID=A0ABQ7X297_BRANA|nr:hypothetical protein HID58_090309 [Brassica napus]